ncbi:MAG: hypothetical protein ACYDA9_10640 [Terriglobia bacterium]
MNFIVEQQAQFTVDMQALKERQAAAQTQIDENRDRIRQLVDVTMSLARHSEDLDRHGKETDRRIQELVESGKHTDRRLDALIDTVDKFLRKNGA